MSTALDTQETTTWPPKLPPRLQQGVTLLVSITLYLSIGVLFYTHEEKPCESEERLSDPAYDADTCVEHWTFIDALYFSMVTMSTVGFGDLSPGSDGAKVFTSAYILVGILVVFVQVSAALSGLVNYLESLTMDALRRLCPCRYKPKVMDIDGDGKADFELPPCALFYWARHCSFPLVVITVLQFISAAIFTQCQDDLQYWDAFYHCLVTATTVGYGDVTLKTQTAKAWAFFHIAVSVSWLAAFISEVGQRRKIREGELLEVRMLARSLDKDLMKSLDRFGNGVDKLEYVIGMLIELGAELCGTPLKWDDVEPFIAQFDAADVDRSGILTKEDLALIAERRRCSVGDKKAALLASRAQTMRTLDRIDSSASRRRPSQTLRTPVSTPNSPSSQRKSTLNPISATDETRTEDLS
mmetsp:Transcript_140543/g.437062  ORF Transcript_140543/g.437062 Transcript_140543/m.437062 type:complete len:412 (-) Transcript_140543:19-1254(-)